MPCELCETDGGAPIWRDARCRVVRVAEPGYPGYCRAIWNRHVSEMTDLAKAERTHLLRVVLALESVLRRLLQPHKINLASLGNVTPHLHWHVVPRFRDDPHFPDPVWGTPIRRAGPATRAVSDAELAAALARAMRRR